MTERSLVGIVAKVYLVTGLTLGCSSGPTAESPPPPPVPAPSLDESTPIPPSPGGEPAPPSPATPPDETTPPDEAPDPCDGHRAAFRAAMDQATGECRDASDCGCFSPVVAEAGCGGITDAATATRLGEIQRIFRGERCPWPRHCAPWECNPTCEAGRCRNEAKRGMLLPLP